MDDPFGTSVRLPNGPGMSMRATAAAEPMPRSSSPGAAMLNDRMPPTAPRRQLQYGDTITLSNNDDARGWLSAVPGDTNLRIDELNEEVTVPPNVGQCRFVVCAPRRYVASKKLRKEMDSGKPTDLLREQVREEQMRNESDEKAAEGSYVLYGATVQLKHLSTGFFVTRQKAVAKRERDCLRVELVEHGHDGSHWRLLPSYKYRELGTRVPFGDHVYFQVQGSGGYLRVGGIDPTAVSLHESYVENTIEANSGQSPSRWVIMPFRTVEVSARKVLGGGDTLYISHQETMSLLGWSEQVDCQGHREDAIRFIGGADLEMSFDELPPHTNALWKAEAQHMLWGGLPLDPGCLYRLKNAGTSLYLSAQRSGSTGLTMDYMDHDCLWEFVPVDGEAAAEEGAGELRNVFMRHAPTGFWLRNEKGKLCIAEGKDLNQHCALVKPPRGNLRSVDWARVRRIQLRDLHRNWSDARAETDAEMYQTCIEEGVDVMKQLLWFLCKGPSGSEPGNGPPPDWDALGEALECAPGEASQRLLRELGLVDATLLLLERIMPRVAENHPTDPPALQNLATLGHWMLRVACTGSPEGKQHISSHLSRIVRHMSMVAPRSVGAVQLLSELLHDNRSMLRELTERDIQEFVEVYLRSTPRRPQDLELLAKLCICQGSPMIFIQTSIARRFHDLGEGALPQVVWVRGECGKRRLRIEISDADGTTNSVVASDSPVGRHGGAMRLKSAALGLAMRSAGMNSACLKMGAKQVKAQQSERMLQLLLVRTLDLFTACATGRNEEGCAVARKEDPGHWRSREGLTELARNSSLSQTLRRAALRLLVTIYADREPLTRRPTVRYTRVWSKALARRPSITQREGAERHYDKIADVLETVHVCLRDGLVRLDEACTPRSYAPGAAPPEREAHSGVREAADLVRCCTWAIGELIALGGMGLEQDPETPERQEAKRFTDTLTGALESHGAAEVGADVTECLDKLFDLRLDLRISVLFESYDRYYREKEGEVLPVPAGVMADLVKETFEGATLTDKISGENVENFSRTLVQVVATAPSLELKRRAFRLLYRHAAQPAHLIREVKKVIVLALEEAVAVHSQSQKAALTIGRQKEKISMQPVGPEGKQELPQECVAANRAVRDTLKGLCRLLRREDEPASEVPPTECTPRLGSWDEDGRIVEGYPADIVRKYQDVMRNADVHRTVIEVLYLSLKRVKVQREMHNVPPGSVVLYDEDIATNTEQLKTFTECYSFLRLFVKDNKENQELVFKHFTHFLRHVGVRNLSVADTIAETVRDNPGLAAQVDDKLLRTFIQAIVKHGKRARWLRLMEAFVEADGKPVPRNQERILNLILAEEGETVLELDGDQGGDGAPIGEGDKTRYELLLECEHEAGGMQSFLRYHVTCVRLLARCVAGNRTNTQRQRCASLMSLERTLQSIVALERQDGVGELDAPVCPRLQQHAVRFVKAAFVSFLHHVHIDAKATVGFREKKVRDMLWKPGGVIEGFCGDLRAFTEQIGEPGSPAPSAFSECWERSPRARGASPPASPGSPTKAERERRERQNKLLMRRHRLSSYVETALLPMLARFLAVKEGKMTCFAASGGDAEVHQDMVRQLVLCGAQAAAALARNARSQAQLGPARDLAIALSTKYRSRGPGSENASTAAAPKDSFIGASFGADIDDELVPAGSPRVLGQDVLDAVTDAVEAAEEAAERLQKKTEVRNPKEQEAEHFKQNWSHWWGKTGNSGLAHKLGVNPQQTVGKGLRRLVALLAPREDVLGEVAGLLYHGERDDKMLCLSALRVLRGWLCFGEAAADERAVSGDEWEAFLRGEIPGYAVGPCPQKGPQQQRRERLADRQKLGARYGFVPAAVAAARDADAQVSREALQLLVLLTHGHYRLTGSEVQDAVYEVIGGEQPLRDSSRDFISAVRQHIRQAILALKERKRMLKRKKAEREARRHAREQARRLRDGITSDAGSEPASTCAGSEASAVSRIITNTPLLADDDAETETAPFWDDASVTDVLDIVRNLCKGKHSRMQKLLATGGAGGGRETLLGEMTSYLMQVEPQLSVRSAANKAPLRVIERLYLALREIVRGSPSCFDALLDTKVCDVTCRIMPHLRYDALLTGRPRRDEHQTVDDCKIQVRRAILQLLRALVEGLNTASAEPAQRLTAAVDADVFMESFREVCKMLQAPPPAACMDRRGSVDSVSDLPAVSSDEYTEKLAMLRTEGALACIVLHGLADHNKTLAKLIAREPEASAEQARQVWRMRMIEVQRRGELTRLRFSLSPAAAEIGAAARFTAVTKQLQTKAVAADDDEERHRIFQEGMVELVRGEIKERKLKDKKGFRKLHEMRDLVTAVPLYATLLMNALLLLCEPIVFGAAAGQDANATAAADASAGQACNETGGVLAAGAELLASAGPALLVLASMVHVFVSGLRLTHLLAIHWAFEWEHSEAEAPFRRVMAALRGRVGVEVAYLVFSLAGLLWSPYFYTVHMMELMDTPPVRLLLDCVLTNSVKLAQAGAVIVLVVYIYSVMGFKFFPDRHEDGKCQTLLNCFISYLDGGLTGGGIHGVLTGFTSPVSLWEADMLPWLLTAMQMSYFTVYVVVLLGVFSGIIIDSFGQLRDETSEVNERLRTKCFISGLDKSMIEQAGGEALPVGAYCDLFIHLLTADEEEFSDLEMYVSELVQRCDVGWLPLRKCFAVAEATGEPEKHAAATADHTVQVLERLILQQGQMLGQRISQLEKIVAQMAPQQGGGTARRPSLGGTSKLNRGLHEYRVTGAVDETPGATPFLVKDPGERSAFSAPEAEPEMALRAKLAELRARLGTM